MIRFLRDIFLDRHRELRPVWRIIMFCTVLFAVSFALLTPLAAIDPAGKIPQLLTLVLATLIASYIMTRFVHRKPFGAFGLTLHPSTHRELLSGLAMGFLMMAGVFVVECSLGMAVVTPRGMPVATILSLVLLGGCEFFLAASIEELWFRGYLFQVLIQWITLIPAIAVMGVLFALAHGFNPGVGIVAYVNIALVSITLSLAYYKTRGLWMPIGLHFAWNFAQTTIFGFPTSGIAPAGHSLLELTQSGPDWVTGGAFGPEGGILATLSVVAGTWYLLKSRRVRSEDGIVTLDSLEDVLSGPVSALERKP
jgi:membrane protease YdiL (CAAX protease family)